MSSSRQNEPFWSGSGWYYNHQQQYRNRHYHDDTTTTSTAASQRLPGGPHHSREQDRRDREIGRYLRRHGYLHPDYRSNSFSFPGYNEYLSLFQRRHAPRPPSSVISPIPYPQRSQPPPPDHPLLNAHPLHPAPVPAYTHDLHQTVFSSPAFLHLFLSPGYLGHLTNPIPSNNPDLTRPIIILHPGRDYRLLMTRVFHAVKTVNPPAWGVSDIPPATWDGWGVKLFLPRDGPRIMKDIWETTGEMWHHVEVRLVPPRRLIDFNWWCTTSEQVVALEGLRWDEECEMYGRFGGVVGEEEGKEVEERERKDRVEKEGKEREERGRKEKERKEKMEGESRKD